jgi:hypothetical protein
LILVAGCSSAHKQSSSQAGTAAHASTNSFPATRGISAADLQQFAAKPSVPFEGENWQPMFDGKSLTGWRQTQFGGGGDVEIESGLMLMNMGDPFNGINWTNDFPKINYEIALDAARLAGSDFFCGLTVPVGDSFCSLIVGGWGGSLVGISSLDGMDASENETTKFVDFQQSRWYRIRLRVTEGRIEGWIDQKKMVDVVTTDTKISLRPGEIELSKPMGIACWQTTAALREIKFRKL